MSSGVEAIVFVANRELSDLGITEKNIGTSWHVTNEFLSGLPASFGMSSVDFYAVLNQRNLSGLVGEVYKHALGTEVSHLVPNPHPDGRPDLLDLRSEEARAHFRNNCFDPVGGAPLREWLAPFEFGGVEVKATIGDITGASNFPIGTSRVEAVRGLNYWAHHRHACRLLGVYYDFCAATGGAPQVKALFLAEVQQDDWYRVSTGNPNKKKTSNTSLNASGRNAIKSGLVATSGEKAYVVMLKRVGVAL